MGHHVDTHSCGKQRRDVLIIDLLLLEEHFIFLIHDRIILSDD